MNTDKTYAEKIASEYAPKETRKVVALKKLDKRAKAPANVFVIGGGGTLFMIVGVIIGIIGIAGVSVNYPIYRRILDNSKKKYSADIIALAKEIAEE